MSIRFHTVATRLIQILDKAEVERTTAILITLKLGNCRLSGIGGIKTNNASASGPTTGFVLYFGLLNFANCRE